MPGGSSDRRPRIRRLLTLLGALLVAAAAPAAAASPPELEVSMDHFEFHPEELTVAAGTTVSWTYDAEATDPEPNCESPQFRATDACPGHSTTAFDEGPDGEPLWDSGVHREDGFPFSHTFDEPGTYAYYCSIHGGDDPNNPVTDMEAVIVVTADDGSGGAPQDADEAGGGAETDDSASTLPATGGPATAVAGLGALLLAALLRPRRRAG